MSTYLLDTHILLWSLSDSEKLPQRIKDIIADPENHIVVSAVSIWEISIKKSLKKLEVPDSMIDVLKENHIDFLPITVDHVLFIEKLPKIHNDPFDRLLIAQAFVEGMTLVTVDSIIPQYNVECI